MGRPLKSQFFGVPKGTGFGGEAVASVTVGGTNNNYSSFPTVTFSAPEQPGGTTATGSAVMRVHAVSIAAAGTGYEAGDVLTLVAGTGTAATITVDTVDTGGEILTASVTTGGSYTAFATLTGLGVTTEGAGENAQFDVTALAVVSITVSTAGSGYLSGPTVTTSPTGNATLTAVLAAANANTILATAFVRGGSSAVAADIVSQKGSRRYKVTTAQGSSVCKLVTTAPGEGEMRIIATDSDNGTYFVTKLTGRKAVLVPDTGVQFAAGSRVKWSFGAAEENIKVTIQNG